VGADFPCPRRPPGIDQQHNRRKPICGGPHPPHPSTFSDEDLRDGHPDLSDSSGRCHRENEAFSIPPSDLVFPEFDLSRPFTVRLKEANRPRELFGAEFGRDGPNGREIRDQPTRPLDGLMLDSRRGGMLSLGHRPIDSLRAEPGLLRDGPEFVHRYGSAVFSAFDLRCTFQNSVCVNFAEHSRSVIC